MKRSQPAETRLIRESTAEFLIVTGQAGEQIIKARHEGETVWLSERLMATLLAVGVPTINEHQKNVCSPVGGSREAILRKSRAVESEGTRESERSIGHYSLDAITSVGYRANSKRAPKFRQWATRLLKELVVKGYCSTACGWRSLPFLADVGPNAFRISCEPQARSPSRPGFADVGSGAVQLADSRDSVGSGQPHIFKA